MRHIPDEELHAYLDQALSRAQCVEIESHLASCQACQDLRDGIAALRDRTTALLATLAPPRRFPVPLDQLRGLAAARSARRHQLRRAGVWAASLAGAVALGWGANNYFSPPTVRHGPAPLRPAPALASAPAASAPADSGGRSIALRPDSAATVGAPRPSAGTPTPAATVAARPASARAAPVIIEPPRIEVSTATLPPVGSDGGLGGIWRTVSWASARTERGDSVPHLDGLPVVEVQVGQTRPGGNKSIMVVAQQLKSGQVIRTIEGPAADVSELLANRAGASPWPTMEGAGISGGDGAMALRHGDRMLAITAPLSNDSLRAMIRRLNAEMRQK